MDIHESYTFRYAALHTKIQLPMKILETQRALQLLVFQKPIHD